MGVLRRPSPQGKSTYQHVHYQHLTMFSQIFSPRLLVLQDSSLCIPISTGLDISSGLFSEVSVVEVEATCCKISSKLVKCIIHRNPTQILRVFKLYTLLYTNMCSLVSLIFTEVYIMYRSSSSSNQCSEFY